MNNLGMRINSLEMELAELKKLIKKENKVWKPKETEGYYTILSNNQVVGEHNNYTDYDIGTVDYGNYFKTKQEAIKQAEYNRVMNRFRKYCEAYSEPFDWSNIDQFKYSLYFSNNTNTIEFDWRGRDHDTFQIYASSKQILKDAIIYSAGSEEEFKRIVFGVNNGNN